MTQPNNELDQRPFESLMEELETLTQKMESGEIPLEDWVKYYTEAMALLKACQKKLDAAELKIEQLTAN